MLVPDLVKEVQLLVCSIASTVMYLQQKLHIPWIDLRVNDIHDLIAYLPTQFFTAVETSDKQFISDGLVSNVLF